MISLVGVIFLEILWKTVYFKLLICSARSSHILKYDNHLELAFISVLTSKYRRTIGSSDRKIKYNKSYKV